MDSLIHIPAEDEVAKLPLQRKKEENMALMSLKKTSKQVVESLKEFSKANKHRKQMTLAFQSSNAKFARASFVVKRAREGSNGCC